MDKVAYLAQDEVKEFVSWLVENFSTLPICLRIGKSRFVPTAVKEDIIGFGNVLDHYVWRSTGMDTGDWNESKARLSVLSDALRSAVNKNNENAALAACESILDWGGNRSRKVGAYPFLKNLFDTNTLCSYIKNSGNVFLLAAADEAYLSPTIVRMNAMLTKVHALYATDGLPIYDSRVAAAIATLVEIYRRQTQKHWDEVLEELKFPATIAQRSVECFAKDSLSHGIMVYGDIATPQRWASAKIRLGWIMQAVLDENEKLFELEVNERMHAFEACLFILGYNIASLRPTLNIGQWQPAEKIITKLNSVQQKVLQISLLEKNAHTLSLSNSNFKYRGSLENGFIVDHATTSPYFSMELLSELLSEFEGQVIFLNAKRGTLKELEDKDSGTLGGWLGVHYGWLGNHASHIAGILVAEGLALQVDPPKGKRGVYLRFDVTGSMRP